MHLLQAMTYLQVCICCCSQTIAAAFLYVERAVITSLYWRRGLASSSWNKTALSLMIRDWPALSQATLPYLPNFDVLHPSSSQKCLHNQITSLYCEASPPRALQTTHCMCRPSQYEQCHSCAALTTYTKAYFLTTLFCAGMQTLWAVTVMMRMLNPPSTPMETTPARPQAAQVSMPLVTEPPCLICMLAAALLPHVIYWCIEW